MSAAAQASLLVRAGEWTCALPLSRVVETMRALPRNVCADVPEYVLGVSVIRGTATAVVDLGWLLGNRGSEAVERYVVTVLGESPVALAVQDVVGIRWLKPDEVVPLTGALEDFSARQVEGLGVVDGEMVALLSESAVLATSVPDEIEADPENDG